MSVCVHHQVLTVVCACVFQVLTGSAEMEITILQDVCETLDNCKVLACMIDAPVPSPMCGHPTHPLHPLVFTLCRRSLVQRMVWGEASKATAVSSAVQAADVFEDIEMDPDEDEDDEDL